jgi:tRNA(Ile)-lysidine synthase
LYQQAATANRLDRFLLQSQPLAIQRRVIRQFLTHRLGKMPTFNQIEDTIALLAAPNRTRTSTFSQGLAAEVLGKWIVVVGTGFRN